MKTNSFGRLVATVSVGMAASCFLNGCSALQTPQQACVAPDTTNAIAKLLAEGAAGQAPMVGALVGTTIDLNQFPDVVEGLWQRKLISIEHITLKSFDKDTKVVRCAGVLTMDLKAGVPAAANKNPLAALASGNAEVPIEYERQPEANGSSYVYRLDSAEDYQGPMLLMAASNQKPAAPSPPAAPQAANDADKAEAVALDAKLAAIPFGAPTRPPFENYPATPFSGQAVMPDYTGDQKDYAEFHTRLDEAAKGGVNFAGEVALAQWGCGTQCSAVTAINLRTGKIYDFPLGGEDNLMLDLKFTPTSNLVAANWQSADDSKGQHYCISEWYLWTGTGFNEIAKSKQQGDCPLG